MLLLYSKPIPLKLLKLLDQHQILKNPSIPAITYDTSRHSNITSPIWALSVNLIWNLHALDILITHRLNGKNYLQWSSFVPISSVVKEKVITLPALLILLPSLIQIQLGTGNWLINIMNLKIGQNFMFYSTAKEILGSIKETYSTWWILLNFSR